MGSIPINRARAQIICTRPHDYAPAQGEAAAYLMKTSNATEDEQRLGI